MPLLPTEIQIEAEQLRRDFLAFVRAAWSQVEPGEFVEGIHIDLMCEQLARVATGEIHRLLINLPPRHGKSTIINVLFPAWMTIRDPAIRILSASYGLDLATRDSVRARRLIESAWCAARWGATLQLRDDQSEKTRYETTAGGARLATAVGGAATGEGGDLIVIDDAMKVSDANSSIKRQNTIDWYAQTMSTRFNDPRSGAMIIVGQRVHEGDLFGHLLADPNHGWTHLCLPAEYDPGHPFLWPDDPRTTAGQPLWPQRYGTGELARLKAALGTYGTAGQLQQLPVPAEGGILRRDWFSWFDPATLGPVDYLVQSWDLAFTGNENADYVVGQVWAISGTDFYLLYQVRDRMTFNETVQAIRNLTTHVEAHIPNQRGHAIVIEDAAVARAVNDSLTREIPGIVLRLPHGDKITRVHAISQHIESGHVHLPGATDPNGNPDPAHTPDWVIGFLHEVTTFPQGRHDDQTDAMSQALAELTRGYPRIRVLG